MEYLTAQDFAAELEISIGFFVKIRVAGGIPKHDKRNGYRNKVWSVATVNKFKKTFDRAAQGHKFFTGRINAEKNNRANQQTTFNNWLKSHKLAIG